MDDTTINEKQIHEDDLTDWTEYNILCDMCGLEESTRSDNAKCAVINAIREGFKVVGEFSIACRYCQEKSDD